jgi:hypothetical protein
MISVHDLPAIANPMQSTNTLIPSAPARTKGVTYSARRELGPSCAF